MADIVELAEAVSKEIGGSEVMFAPELDLKGLREMRVIVVPSALALRHVARGAQEDSLKVQVGVLKKCTEDEVVDLVNTVVGIGRGFLGKSLAGARCTGVDYAPLYSPEHLRERRQFTGIVELTFKSVR